MDISYLFQDTELPEFEQQPTSVCRLIPGERGNLFTLLYLPGGAGPHPTVLLAHGYPGCEQNMDLAQALRRVGFAVMTFHYSGSWGSDGEYALENCLEDAETVLTYLMENRDEWNLDEDRFFMVGHSMGAFVTAHMLARYEELRAGVLITPFDVGRVYLEGRKDPVCRRNLMEVLYCGDGWLRGFSADKLLNELSLHAREYRLTALCPSLSRKPILCIGANRDEDAPVALHCYPLCEAMEKGGARQFFYEEFCTDHTLASRRIILCRDVAEFLLRYLP